MVERLNMQNMQMIGSPSSTNRFKIHTHRCIEILLETETDTLIEFCISFEQFIALNCKSMSMCLHFRCLSVGGLGCSSRDLTRPHPKR